MHAAHVWASSACNATHWRRWVWSRYAARAGGRCRRLGGRRRVTRACWRHGDEGPPASLPGRNEAPSAPLRWCSTPAAASTRCGRPLRWHLSPCDASLASATRTAAGVTACSTAPLGRAQLPLGWLPATPDTTISPVGNGGPAVPLCLVGALTTPSGRDHRGACRRRAVPGAPAGRGRPNGHRRGRHRCRCPARASTCSSEPVFPPMRRPSPYDVHVRTPGLAMRCHGCHCAGAGPAHRRPLAAVGRRDDIRRRAMRRCWRLGRPDLHVPWSRERCGPLRWLPLTPNVQGVPPSPTEGYRRRCAEVDALPAPSARYCRGARRRCAVLCAPVATCAEWHWCRSHRSGGTARADTCSSGHVFPPMPRPSSYDAHVLTPGSATRCQWRCCAGAGSPPRRPLDAVGH